MSIHFNINQGRKKHEEVSITPSSTIDTKGFAVRQQPTVVVAPASVVAEETTRDDNLDGMEAFANEDKLRQEFEDEEYDEPVGSSRQPMPEEYEEYEEEDEDRGPVYPAEEPRSCDARL
jgi:hypothetical protein